MDAWHEIARAVTSSDDELVLRERSGMFEIRCNGWDLISSRAHFSEQRMAELACDRLDAEAPRVLIGGLGMGYTLRAALDRLPATAEVVVAELLPEIVAWNRGVLGKLAGHPLDDPRVVVACGDVADLLREAAFDAIILDVDNGPDAVMVRGNSSLYDADGLQRLRRALRRRRGVSANSQPSTGRPAPDETAACLSLRGRLVEAIPVVTNRRQFVMTGIASARRPRNDRGRQFPAPVPDGASGVLAIWSADPSPDFERRLSDAGLRWTRTDVPARGAPDDPLHTIYLAHA